MPTTVLGARAAAVRETIAELAEAGLDPLELVHEVSERVRRVVPYDWGSWSTNDPETLLQTEAFVAEGFVDCAFGIEQMRIELAGGDVNLFDALDRSGAVAASLSGATGGDLAASARHRAVFAPRGLDDELRVLARSGDATWGTAQLARAADAPPFSEDEVRFVASVATHLGAGLRAGLARMPVAAPASGGAGMLVLGPGGEIEASTADAERWLARMPSPWGRDYLPPTIEGVAEHARGVARGGEDLRPARLRLRIPGEGWLLVRADVLNAAVGGGALGDDTRVAVMIEPAARADLVPLLHAIHGLTARERAVTELLVSGLSTDAIADRLAISRHTLRDHVKAVFAKVGVGSRPELTAVFGTEAPAR
jgi:DNA-binding CsgD family transcriptional regulator